MAEFAKKIEVVIHPGGSATLLIDGQELAWHVNSDGLELGSKLNEYPYLTVSIPAEQIVTRFAEPVAKAPEINAAPVGKVGDIIQLDGEDTPNPPANVLAFEHLEDNSGVCYLHRTGGESWSWSYNSDKRGSISESWEDSVYGFEGSLKVITVTDL